MTTKTEPKANGKAPEGASPPDKAPEPDKITPRQQLLRDIAGAEQAAEQLAAQANAQHGFVNGLKKALALLPEDG